MPRGNRRAAHLSHPGLRSSSHYMQKAAPILKNKHCCSPPGVVTRWQRTRRTNRKVPPQRLYFQVHRDACAEVEFIWPDEPGHSTIHVYRTLSASTLREQPVEGRDHTRACNRSIPAWTGEGCPAAGFSVPLCSASFVIRFTYRTLLSGTSHFMTVSTQLFRYELHTLPLREQIG